MSYVYCTYLSSVDVVAPIGAAAHHICKGRLLLVSIIRVCAFFAAVSAVTVGPEVLWVGRGCQSCTSVAPTRSASAAADAGVISSMVGGVGEL